MLYNSFWFLVFFGVLAIVHYATPARWRWMLLLVASVYFYAALNPIFPLLLGAVSLLAYGAALAIGAASDARRRRALLAASISSVIGVLLVVKYSDFLADAFGIPVGRFHFGAVAGLSFYTFSCVSYLADVGARRLPPERRLGHFLLYVAFFPKLLAGPIERARPFLAQLREPAVFESERVTLGLQLMLWGFFKKVMIADRLAPFVDAAYRRPEFAASGDLLLATYFFAFQIYCDFSGYSDIAVGAAKVLGFDLMENFRRPYLSTSVREFWGGRWHRSLSAWFRDYMFVPMGGSRVPLARICVNLMAVFLVSGLWHGANWTFVVWGGLNGLFMVVSLATAGARRTLTPWYGFPAGAGSWLSRLWTFHLVLITWVFFRAASLADASLILKRLAGSAASLPRQVWARVTTGEMLVSVSLIALLLALETLDERRPLWERVGERPVVVRWAVYYAMLLALIVMGSWNLQQFVYMQF